MQHRSEADRLKRQSQDTKKTRLAEKLEAGNDIREAAEDEAPEARLTGSKSQKRATRRRRRTETHKTQSDATERDYTRIEGKFRTVEKKNDIREAAEDEATQKRG